MSGSLHNRYSLRDLEAFGVRQAVLNGEIELGSLPRLANLLHSVSGNVRASLRFRQRGAGLVGVTLEYDTTVELMCQRCLEPMSQPLADSVDITLLPSDTDTYVPEGTEPVFLDDGRLQPAALLEDELIVALPLVPKHARIEDCGSLARLVETGEQKAGAEGSDLQ